MSVKRFSLPLSRRAAFSLVEILLVVAIIAIIAATCTPSLVKSMRGNRLRTSTRMVVQAVRYARTMAILNQTEYSVVFSTAANTVEVTPGAAVAKPDPFAAPPPPEEAAAPGGTPLAPEAPAGLPGLAPGGAVARDLRGVRIASVVVRGDDPFGHGAQGVVYESNGRCTPFEVKLVDENGNGMTIKVDAVGSVATEWSGGG